METVATMPKIVSAEEYSRKPFTLHFLNLSVSITEGWRSEGLTQPFTTLHHPSLVRHTEEIRPRESAQWRVVKGGEGLEQPFTPIFSWLSVTYTVKVKGEGFLEIFFGVHRITGRGSSTRKSEPRYLSTVTTGQSVINKELDEAKLSHLA